MGIENRDYVRGSSYGGSYYGGSYTGSGGMPPACKWLLIVTIAVFVLQLVITTTPTESQIEQHRKDLVKLYESIGVPDEQIEPAIDQSVRRFAKTPQSIVQNWFALAPDKVISSFQIWRLVTYAFCHDDGSVWHIIFNMLALWFFGPTLERMYGTREFTWFYLTAAFMAGLAFLGFELFLGNVTPVIGASGAVMGVLMLYAVHYPRQIIRIWGIIPVEVRWLVAIFIIFDLFPVLQSLGGRANADNVAHAAHLGGLAFGYLYFRYQLRLERLFSGFSLPLPSKPISKGDVKLYQPPDDLDEQVDAILEKITEHGESSLTDKERDILKAASNRYKKRS